MAASSGQIVYDKGNDHLIDADRCAILRHYLDTIEEINPVPLGIRVEAF